MDSAGFSSFQNNSFMIVWMLDRSAVAYSLRRVCCQLYHVVKKAMKAENTSFPVYRGDTFNKYSRPDASVRLLEVDY